MANGMIALMDTFTIAAAIALRASSMGIALLSSLPLLIGSLGQFFLPAFADPKKGRKYYVLWGVRVQALFLFLAGLAGWVSEPWAPWVLIGLLVISSVGANLTGPFWVAWMGDLIPGASRGRHFAWRSVFFSWMYLSCSLTAGLLSRGYGAHNAPWILFACIFATAGLLRTISYFFLTQQYEPVSTQALDVFSPFKFRPGRDFLIYCVATGIFQGAAAMSGPFFNVWYLRDLHINYMHLAIILTTTVLGSITFAGFWGRLSDTRGTSRVLWISGLFIVIIPFPYLFFHGKLFMYVWGFYSGAVWGGYNLANFSHMLNATDQLHRSHYIAFGSLVVGLIACGFSLIGGFLATRLPVLFEWQLQSLFLLSGILRLVVFLSMFGKFREYREALPENLTDIYMELPGFRIGAGLIRNVFRGLRV